MAAGYGYDGVGNLQNLQYGNNVTAQFQFDSLNRLTNSGWTMSGGTLAKFYYQLGRTGDRTNLTETLQSVTTNRVSSWQYDSLYRLTTEAIAGTTTTYGLDVVGNRTNRSTGIGGLPAQNPSYNTNDWLATDAYDSNGNTLWTTNNGLGTGPYAYDPLNHLVSVANTVVKLGYDGDGNRAWKSTSTGTNTFYVLDDRNPSGYVQVLEEWTVVNTTTNLARVYNYGLQLISQRQPSVSTNYFIFDGHGSTRLLTDTGGNVANAFTYDAYGNLIYSTVSPQTFYLYTGQQWDPDLGQYSLRARTYNAGTGRFWTMDTFEGSNEDPLSLHKYNYCQAHPVNMADPTGHDGELISFAISAAISGTLSAIDTYIATGGKAKAMDLVTSFAIGGVVGGLTGGVGSLLWECGIGGRIAVGAIGISFGVAGVENAMGQGNNRLALYRAATLGLGMIGLVEGWPLGRPYGEMGTTSVGNVGQARVVQMCNNTGWKKVLSLQNGSGNGIDVIGITPENNLGVIEVKTARAGMIGDLKPSQRFWESYVLGVLKELATKGTLRGQTVGADQQRIATELLELYYSDPLKASGNVVGVDLNSNQMFVSPWARSPD